MIYKVIKRVLVLFVSRKFKSIGSNVLFNPFDDFTFSNISIGNSVYIGPGARFNCSRSEIIIGNKVLFGPDVTIMGGDHRIDVVGQYIYDVTEKLPANDLGVTVGDDVWVGTRSVLLSGVEIGTGSVIAAGSVVTKSVPPYTIVGGVPARILKPRFSEQELREHIRIMDGGNVRN